MLMIDWFSGLIRVPHHYEISGGFVTSTDDTGILLWKKSKFQPVEGSYSDKVMIKSESIDSLNSHIYVDGNLVKYFQGHNVFGTNDLKELIKHFILDITFKGIIEPVEEPLKYVLKTKISRLDLTCSYRLKDTEEVNSWLEGAEANTTMKYRGRGIFTRGTLYFGKHSTRWAIKLYNKHTELISNSKKHKRLDNELLAYSNGLLRVELVIRSKELIKQNNDKQFLLENYTRKWSTDKYKQYLENMEIGKMNSKDTDKKDELTSSENSTYELYRAGLPIKSILSRATFYRHKKSILAKIGINISSNNVVNINTKRLPEFEFITARAETVPPEFLTKEYFFNPSNKLKLVS